MKKLVSMLMVAFLTGSLGVMLLIPPAPALAMDAGFQTTLAPRNVIVGSPVAIGGSRTAAFPAGQGWNPGESITIWLAATNGQKDWTVPLGSVVGIAVADGNGSWGASFLMPDRRTGLHEIYVQGSTNSALFTARGITPAAGLYSGANLVGGVPPGAEHGAGVIRTLFPTAAPPTMRADTYVNTINVVPYLERSPASGPAGTLVTAKGTGFGSLESGITVNFSGPGAPPYAVDRVVGSGIAADINGSWEASFVVPDGPAGPYSINVNAGSALVVSGAVAYSAGPPVVAAKSGVVVSTQALPGLRTFNIARVLRLIPDRPSPGATVYMLGRGLASSSTVTVKLDGTVMTTTPAAVTTNANGLFLASFTVPATGVSYGPHGVAATDAGGGAATAPLTVVRVAVIQLTPKYGIPGDTITATGAGFNGVALVDLTFDGSSLRTTPEAVITNPDGGFTASFLVPERSAPGYHRVVATDMYGEHDSADFTVQSPPVRAVP